MNAVAKPRRLPSKVVALSLCICGPASMGPSGIATSEKRPVTVADAIEMTRLGTNDHSGGNTPAKDIASFSPDGRNAVILTKRGNLRQNTIDYTLFLWRTDRLPAITLPEALLTLSSSSNRPAIRDIKWYDDSNAISFLGEKPRTLTQVYAFEIRSRKLTQLTNHSANVISHSLTPDWKHVAYLAEHEQESIWTKEAQGKGLWIQRQHLTNLVLGRKEALQPELFVVSTSNLKSHPRKIPISFTPYAGPISLSPDGQHIVLFDGFTDPVPPLWSEYEDSVIKRHLNDRHGQYAPFQRYKLIDTRTGAVRILLNSPIRPEPLDSEAVWCSNGKSVILTNTYLPLDRVSDVERHDRAATPFTVEVNILTGDVTEIARGGTLIYSWRPTINELVLQSRERVGSPTSAQVFLTFHRQGLGWKSVATHSIPDRQPEIMLDEDMNTPPRVLVKQKTNGKKVLLLDLNPQFRKFRFGAVKEIEWTTFAGQSEKGRLYYPVSYEEGMRYPLVIQTHAYDQPYRFEIEGPFTTAFAAQPLAGKGIMVLEAQIHHTPGEGTPSEADEAISVYEGGIHRLVRDGLIDVDRIGIIGFSRTSLHVKAALTSPKFRFAAASVTDGIDGGYFQYVAAGTPQAWEQFNGGSPFGKGLQLWLQHSAGFRIQNVHTPLLINSLNPFSLVAEWEWFAALRRLERPVDMLYLQDGSHVLERPWDRRASQQANVDWFCFWLKGEEDPDPVKAEQYARWRELRKMQQQDGTTSRETSSAPFH